MKLKSKIISLVVCLSFCLVALFNAVYFRDENIKTHQTIMNSSNIDYMSLLEDFDEKELVIEEEKVKLDATQYLDEDFFSELDNLSYNDEVVPNSYIDYSFDIDGASSLIIVTISFYENNELVSVETMKGVPFTNEEGKLDAIFNDEGEVVYLSDFADIDEFQNCGLFSKLKKAVKKVTKAVTETVKVAAVAVIGGAVLAGVAVGVTTLAYATGGASLPATLPAAMSTLGWATAGFMTIVGSVGVGSAIINQGIDSIGNSSYNNGVEVENIKFEWLDKAFIATLEKGYTLSMDRAYYVAYVYGGQVNINKSVALNYVEALSVLIAAGLINEMIYPKGFEIITLNKFTNAMLTVYRELISKNIKTDKIGVYTQLRDDAAKLAYACGGFHEGFYRAENHKAFSGSGHYYHFHDAKKAIHVFYGNPS